MSCYQLCDCVSPTPDFANHQQKLPSIALEKVCFFLEKTIKNGLQGWRVAITLGMLHCPFQMNLSNFITMLLIFQASNKISVKDIQSGLLHWQGCLLAACISKDRGFKNLLSAKNRASVGLFLRQPPRIDPSHSTWLMVWCTTKWSMWLSLWYQEWHLSNRITNLSKIWVLQHWRCGGWSSMQSFNKRKIGQCPCTELWTCWRFRIDHFMPFIKKTQKQWQHKLIIAKQKSQNWDFITNAFPQRQPNHWSMLSKLTRKNFKNGFVWCIRRSKQLV